MRSYNNRLASAQSTRDYEHWQRTAADWRASLTEQILMWRNFVGARLKRCEIPIDLNPTV